MNGISAVITPTLDATIACNRSVVAVMPSTQFTRRVQQACRIQVIDCSKECAITGSKALSCSCPPSAAIVTVRSAPAIAYATWLTASGITGLILPGMMEEPACLGGRLISPNPACGPEDRSRRSLQIFESLMALRLSALEKVINTPTSLVASMRSGALTKHTPEISLR